MNRRDILKLCPSLFLIGCGLSRIDQYNILVRSDIIDSEEKSKAILARAKLSWTEDGRIRVLHVQGTPYEMGYQQGVLLRAEIQDNLGYLYAQALNKFHFDELFAEMYERMRPFIPAEYIEEMHGLAHGSRMPLEVIHHIHILPCIGEWGGKRRIKELFKAMYQGTLGTSCSNMCSLKENSKDGKMYTLRILDWGLHRISKLHQYPLITVAKPDQGIPYCNIGWAGFLGAISGLNAQGITLGEMGYGDPPNETMRGKPMPFLLRDILSQAKNLADVRRIITTSPGTNSFVFLMSDGKKGEAEIYVRDRDRFIVYKPGENISDGKNQVTGLKDMLYGGHYNEKMRDLFNANKGNVTPELLMHEIIPQIAMASNFQNVIYSPTDLTFWVTNAASKEERAAEQTYSFFDFAKALHEF